MTKVPAALLGGMPARLRLRGADVNGGDAKAGLPAARLLLNELIGDPQAGRKIFIWGSTRRTLEPHEIALLHNAVFSYGENIPFYVRLQEATHPNGHVERRAAGLLIGYIDRFKLSPGGAQPSSSAIASWLRLCRAALAAAGRI